MFRKSILLLIIMVGLVALVGLSIGQIGLHRLRLKSCFEDVQGLRSGAEVRIAGVEVGTVGSVRPNPQNKNCPAEIEMRLATTYELLVPNDALAEIETRGVLGGSFVIIDATHSSGTPARDYAYLKSKPATRPVSLDDAENAAKAFMMLYKASRSLDKIQNDESKVPAEQPGH